MSQAVSSAGPSSALRNAGLLVLAPDPAPVQEGLDLLSSSGVEVWIERDVNDGPEAFEHFSCGALLVSLCGLDREKKGEVLSVVDRIVDARPGLPCSIVLDDSLEPLLAAVGRRPWLNSFFGSNEGVSPRELAAVMVSRMRRRTFDPTLLTRDSLMSLHWTLYASDERRPTIDRVMAEIQRHKGAPAVLESIELILDELLMNAFFQAPITASGERPNAARPRSERVHLEPGRGIRVQIAWDRASVYLSVRDPYGSLAPSTVLMYLWRGYEGGQRAISFSQRNPGAGLGIYMTYQASKQMILNIEKGRFTEVTALVDLTARRRRRASWTRSLHVIYSGDADAERRA